MYHIVTLTKEIYLLASLFPWLAFGSRIISSCLLGSSNTPLMGFCYATRGSPKQQAAAGCPTWTRTGFNSIFRAAWSIDHGQAKLLADPVKLSSIHSLDMSCASLSNASHVKQRYTRIIRLVYARFSGCATRSSRASSSENSGTIRSGDQNACRLGGNCTTRCSTRRLALRLPRLGRLAAMAPFSTLGLARVPIISAHPLWRTIRQLLPLDSRKFAEHFVRIRLTPYSSPGQHRFRNEC